MSATPTSPNPIVFVASDHGGFQLKGQLLGWLHARGIMASDLGTHAADSVDYPDFALVLVEALRAQPGALGILICGTGLGMSMSANRFPGIRAALCTSGYMARMARLHNDANVLCLGERVVGPGEAEDILQAFLSAPFEGGRHTRRVGKIESLSRGDGPNGEAHS